MNGMRRLVMLRFGATPSVAGAVDHKNLDEGRPLRLEDDATHPILLI